MYQSSIDQVEYLMGLYPETVKRLWLQVPFLLTNATSVAAGQLRCWEPGEHKIWMRPKGEQSIKNKPWDEADEKFRAGYSWLDFYGAIENFERCFQGTAFLVGLRAAGESPNRWRRRQEPRRYRRPERLLDDQERRERRRLSALRLEFP